MRIGDRLDRYVIEKILGEGGMATVYLARHQRLRSLHALKVLRIDVPSIKERLLTEGRVQASLRHPNVVAVTDVLDMDGVCALVMEYVEGPGLHEWIDDPHQKRDLDEVLQLFRGIALGVAAAHRAGLVHRDLKPENVLLASSNVGLVAKVTDFGLVKVTAASNTRSGVMMGTPEYMSPEQIRDSAHVDTRSDLWSLGVMLYELLSGELPFDADESLDVYNRITNLDYVPLEARRPDLPYAVRKTVRQLLQLDPDDRIQTAEEVVAALLPDQLVVSHRPGVTPTQLVASDSPQRAPTTRSKTVVVEEPPPPVGSMPAGRLGARAALASGIGVGVLAFVLTAACLGVLTFRRGTANVEPVDPPVPTLPALRRVQIESSEPLTQLLIDGQPVPTEGNGATASLAPGTHDVVAQAGTCTAQARGCGADCPPGCGSTATRIEVGEGLEPLVVPIALLVTPLPAPEPEPAPAPTVPAPPPPAPALGRLVSNQSYAGWLKSHPDWQPEAAKKSGKASDRYLRKWTDGTPPGQLTQIPWAAARDYCASRGGLVGIDEAPLTWTDGANQEWRDANGKPGWRRSDGVKSTTDPGNESFTFTGARCRR